MNPAGLSLGELVTMAEAHGRQLWDAVSQILEMGYNAWLRDPKKPWIPAAAFHPYERKKLAEAESKAAAEAAEKETAREAFALMREIFVNRKLVG